MSNKNCIISYNNFNKKKVKCPITGLIVAQRVGRGIALLLHDSGTRRWWVVSSAPQPYFTPGTHCRGGWVSPSAGLDRRKISPHRDSIPGPSRGNPVVKRKVKRHGVYGLGWILLPLEMVSSEEHFFCMVGNVLSILLPRKSRGWWGWQFPTLASFCLLPYSEILPGLY